MRGLVFCLVPSGIFADPSDEGWGIIISDSTPDGCNGNSDSYLDLGHVVTPPFRGNLVFDIYGWQFRNKENTGVNDGSVNAPQYKRSFNFIFSRADFDTYYYSYMCGGGRLPEYCAMATQTSTDREIPRSRAKFTVTKLELGNLVPNKLAWIEYMEFKFEVYLPAE